MKKEYYVTVQLTNGGIESLTVEIEDGEQIRYETFEEVIRKYVETNLRTWEPELWTMGHIIAWSEIKLLNDYEDSN